MTAKYDAWRNGMPNLGECSECGFDMYNKNLVNTCKICGSKVCDSCYRVQRCCSDCHKEKFESSNTPQNWLGYRICKSCFREHGDECMECGERMNMPPYGAYRA